VTDAETVVMVTVTATWIVIEMEIDTAIVKEAETVFVTGSAL
jgi:hypothetical protein